jgi:hypothetical protein
MQAMSASIEEVLPHQLTLQLLYFLYVDVMTGVQYQRRRPISG